MPYIHIYTRVRVVRKRFTLVFNFCSHRSVTSTASEDIPLYWPVLHKLSNVQSQWPQNAVVLPGTSIINIARAIIVNIYIYVMHLVNHFVLFRERSDIFPGNRVRLCEEREFQHLRLQMLGHWLRLDNIWPWSEELRN